jgi:hypothetical protein
MVERRERLIELLVYGEQELREMQAAAMQRVDALEKAVKKAEDEYRYEEAVITRRRLRLWRGEDGEPGILERIADQMSIFEPAFSDDGREPEGQRSIFEGVERNTPPEAEAETEVDVVELSDAERVQEEILIHEPATGQDFRDCVAIASLRACQGALEIIEGLEGNKVREAAIRKRLAVLEGSPEGTYDLTDARKKAIAVLAAAHDHSADISNRTAAEDLEIGTPATITRKVAEWLIEEQLAEDVPDHEAVFLTEAGIALARELGFGIYQPDDEPTPDGVVDPSDDDLGGEEESYLADSPEMQQDEDLTAEEAHEDAEPVGVGAGSALDDADDLL